MRTQPKMIVERVRPSKTELLDQLVPWRLVAAHERKNGESCRWECCDGRWVAVALGNDNEHRFVVVTSSRGKRELIDSYEAALALARSWRT